MWENKEYTDQIIKGNDTFESKTDAAKILAGLGKEVLKTREVSEEITKADRESSFIYLSSLTETFKSIRSCFRLLGELVKRVGFSNKSDPEKNIYNITN